MLEIILYQVTSWTGIDAKHGETENFLSPTCTSNANIISWNQMSTPTQAPPPKKTRSLSHQVKKYSEWEVLCHPHKFQTFWEKELLFKCLWLRVENTLLGRVLSHLSVFLQCSYCIPVSNCYNLVVCSYHPPLSGHHIPSLTGPYSVAAGGIPHPVSYSDQRHTCQECLLRRGEILM